MLVNRAARQSEIPPRDFPFRQPFSRRLSALFERQRRQIDRLEREKERLQRELHEERKQNEQERKRIAELEKENSKLKRELEAMAQPSSSPASLSTPSVLPSSNVVMLPAFAL